LYTKIKAIIQLGRNLEDLVWSDFEIILQNQDNFAEIMKILDLEQISNNELYQFSLRIPKLKAFISILQ